MAIDLRVTGFRTHLVVFEISFDDIDELRVFTYIEAASFTNLGPNENDVSDVLRGRILRPTRLHLVHSLGTTLLIRGRDLFYLLTVEREGVYDVIEAYAAAKSRVLHPPRGAAAPPSPSRKSAA
jgi:hypothetical protein